MSKVKVLSVLMVVVAAFVLTVSAVSAAPRPYIQINNGRSMSIHISEQPQMVVQFGNNGSRIDNVRVRCEWDTAIRFVANTAQNGPFNGSQFLAPISGQRLAQLNFPAVDVVDPNLLPDLPQGQNYNVGLNIRIAEAAVGQNNFGGNFRCFLLAADGSVLAQSETTQITVRR